MRIGDTRYRWEFRLLEGETAADFESIEALQPLIGPWVEGIPCDQMELVRVAEYHFRAQLADRLTGEKRQVPAAGLFEILPRELKKFQAALYQRAVDFRAENTFEVATLQELLDHFKERTGFVWAPWCGSEECEARVKDESGGVTIRNFDPDEKPSAECLVCGRPAVYRVAFARAY